MDNNDSFDSQLITQLEQLRETEPRNSHAAAATRAAFLTEARKATQGVSPQPIQRLNEWMAAITTYLAAPRKKRGVPMFSSVLTLIIMLGLAFGGGTVAAAQTSMPDDALYPVKIWSENSRVSFSTNQETQLQLALGFSTRRMEEIRTMLQTGKIPPTPVMNRLQNQLEQALHLAVNMPDEQVQPALLQVQTQLQQHEYRMAQLQLHQDADPALVQIRNQVQTMLQQQLQLCQSGMENPGWLREQLRIREQERSQQQLNNDTQNQNQDGEQYQNQDGALNQNQQSGQNQNQYQNGSKDETPATGPGDSSTPGDGNGPGEGICPNCPSGACDCEGSGQTVPNGNGNKP